MEQSDCGRPTVSVHRAVVRLFLLSGLLAILVGLLLPPSALAQRGPGSTGTGVQIGDPGGLTLKWYRSAPIAYDAVISTDGDDFVVAHAHRLWEQPLPESPLHVYVGPGILAGAEKLSAPLQLRLGASAEAGLNFYAERFEVFLHVTPTLQFLPDRDVGVDGIVGLRYYFRSF
jgi:hypothetical protein